MIQNKSLSRENKTLFEKQNCYVCYVCYVFPLLIFNHGYIYKYIGAGNISNISNIANFNQNKDFVDQKSTNKVFSPNKSFFHATRQKIDINIDLSQIIKIFNRNQINDTNNLKLKQVIGLKVSKYQNLGILDSNILNFKYLIILRQLNEYKEPLSTKIWALYALKGCFSVKKEAYWGLLKNYIQNGITTNIKGSISIYLMIFGGRSDINDSKYYKLSFKQAGSKLTPAPIYNIVDSQKFLCGNNFSTGYPTFKINIDGGLK